MSLVVLKAGLWSPGPAPLPCHPLCSEWFHSLYFICLIHPFFYIETLTPLLAWHINKFPQNVYIHMCKDQHIFTHKHTLVHTYTHTPIHIRVLGRKHSKRILSCQWLRKSSNETMLHEYFHISAWPKLS